MTAPARKVSVLVALLVAALLSVVAAPSASATTRGVYTTAIAFAYGDGNVTLSGNAHGLNPTKRYQLNGYYAINGVNHPIGLYPIIHQTYGYLPDTSLCVAVGSVVWIRVELFNHKLTHEKDFDEDSTVAF